METSKSSEKPPMLATIGRDVGPDRTGVAQGIDAISNLKMDADDSLEATNKGADHLPTMSNKTKSDMASLTESQSQHPNTSTTEPPSAMALLNAVVASCDRQALNDLVGIRRVCRLSNGEPITISEYIIARCTGREGRPLPRSVDRELVYDLLIDRFYMLPDEVIP